MTTAKTENKSVEPRIWCEICHIRIAASEQRTIVDGKTYHPHCYGKAHPKPEDAVR